MGLPISAWNDLKMHLHVLDMQTSHWSQSGAHLRHTGYLKGLQLKVIIIQALNGDCLCIVLRTNTHAKCVIGKPVMKAYLDLSFSILLNLKRETHTDWEQASSNVSESC